MTTLTVGGASIVLPDPLLPYQLTVGVPQQRGYDSSGAQYVYSREQAVVGKYSLKVNLERSELLALIEFYRDTALGYRHAMDWTDYLAVVRPVRFRSLAYTQTTPTTWQATLGLDEA